MHAQSHGMTMRYPATRWQDASPTGSGIVGALMSVPIAATIKIVCENIEGLKPISILMGSGKTCMKEMQTS